MGTSYSIKINEPNRDLDENIMQMKIKTVLDDINGKMSTYINNSELMQINNNNEGKWINVSEDLFYVLENASAISHETNGAFDVTVGPLVNLWGFGPDFNVESIPDNDSINKALQNVGYQFIEFNAATSSIRKLKPEIFIDLSAIAKGYAVDKITELLLSMDINSFMIEIGGEVYAHGKNQNNIPWQIGIEKPLSEIRSVQKIIPLKNMGMATSGDYRIFTEVDGKHYSHLINPETGKPVTHYLTSVTILHPFTMQADALATAALIMGKDRALEFAEHNNLAAFFITRTENGFKEFYSSSFNTYLNQ